MLCMKIGLTSRTPRTLHVIDVENLASSAAPSAADVALIERRYRETAGVGASDHVVLATRAAAAPGAWFGWSLARRLVCSGCDGPPALLCQTLLNEDVANRYDRVVIGSGNAALAEAAARLQAAGVEVTVVARSGRSVSKRLKFAVRDIRLLDQPTVLRTFARRAA